MKIQKYKIRVWNSVMEQLHGGKGIIITEYFIPEHGLCFNTDRGVLNVFKYDTRRSEEYEEVDIFYHLVQIIRGHYDRKEKLYTRLRQFQNGGTKNEF